GVPAEPVGAGGAHPRAQRTTAGSLHVAHPERDPSEHSLMSDTTPTLPQDASDPKARAQALATIREGYEYDYSYQALCFVKDLPKSESYSPAYMAQSLEGVARLKANRLGQAPNWPG